MPSGPRVAVVGTGTMGAMTLWQLARRGVHAVGFDRWAPGHAFGAAGGETRLFRSAYAEGPEYVPLLTESLTEWRALETETGLDLLTLTRGLMIGRSGSAFLRGVLASVTENHLPHEVLSAQEARGRFPETVLDDDEVAVLDERSGVIRAEVSVSAAARAATDRGSVVRVGDAVVAVEPGPTEVTVVTEGGARLPFDRVVVAAGAWANQVRGIELPRLDVQSIAVHWYPVRHPERFAADRFPFVCRDAGVDFCVWPTTDGATVKVGLAAGLDHLGSADELDQRMPDELVPVVDEYVRRYVPDAVPAAVRHAVQVDAWTADHAFIVDTTADDRVVVLAGFSGHGFKMSPVIGRAAADLALTGATSLPVARFRADRFARNPTLR
ncbi:N-methyl-L-tryptophan oxidase [Curtobacterium sp. 9128]|uniref:N-methyl-L-tryptophan oxidase n=1 Tax=Curtobacterium sp. 9128 TaxID=1793722 RepID=UPI0011A4E323|nr:N-methyl-L-tryptophan oxidase [Curtobacterium sp. 9128]